MSRDKYIFTYQAGDGYMKCRLEVNLEEEDLELLLSHIFDFLRGCGYYFTRNKVAEAYDYWEKGY